ncbi:MAG: OadG family transporter subunit [Desulfobulbus sp.]
MQRDVLCASVAVLPDSGRLDTECRPSPCRCISTEAIHPRQSGSSFLFRSNNSTKGLGSMIGEGVKLMVLGMAVVFVFLVFMVLVIQLNSIVLSGFTKREIELDEKRLEEKRLRAMNLKSKSGTEERQRLIAVMAAAIAAHRARKAAERRTA